MACKASEVIDVEVEALQAVYGEDSVMVTNTGGGTAAVELSAKPRTGGDPRRELVSVTLRAECGPEYPDVPPELELPSTSGISEERAADLQAALEQVVQDLRGDLMLVPLCEAVVDWLTDNNAAEGPCSICLESLEDNRPEEVEEDIPRVVRLSCNHCFHWCCFSSWWAWQQREYSQLEQQMIAEHGGDNEFVRQLLHNKLPHKWGHYYGIQCPTCRHKAEEDELSLWAKDLERLRTSQTNRNAVVATGATSVKGCLQADVLRQVQELQARFSSMLSVQESKDGLIDSSKRLFVPTVQVDLQHTDAREARTSGAQEPGPKHPRSGRSRGGRQGRGKRRIRDPSDASGPSAQSAEEQSDRSKSGSANTSAANREGAPSTSRQNNRRITTGARSGLTSQVLHNQAGKDAMNRSNGYCRESRNPCAGAAANLDSPGSQPSSGRNGHHGNGWAGGRGTGRGDVEGHD